MPFPPEMALWPEMPFLPDMAIWQEIVFRPENGNESELN